MKKIKWHVKLWELKSWCVNYWDIITILIAQVPKSINKLLTITVIAYQNLIPFYKKWDLMRPITCFYHHYCLWKNCDRLYFCFIKIVIDRYFWVNVHLIQRLRWSIVYLIMKISIYRCLWPIVLSLH